MPCICDEANGDGRAGRFGLVAELKECIRETASGIGAAVLVLAPLLDRRWRRIFAESARKLLWLSFASQMVPTVVAHQRRHMLRSSDGGTWYFNDVGEGGMDSRKIRLQRVGHGHPDPLCVAYASQVKFESAHSMSHQFILPDERQSRGP